MKRISGLILVLMLAAVFPMTTGNGDMASTNVCLAGFATFNWSSLLNLLTIPFALTAYALVWLVSNAINVRTYGQLRRDPTGQLAFDYRPWLFGARKTVLLPAGSYVVGRGLFYSEVIRLEGEEDRTLLLLPPRYRTHEEELLPIYGFGEVRPIGLRRAWRWLKSLFGFSSSPVTA